MPANWRSQTNMETFKNLNIMNSKNIFLSLATFVFLLGICQSSLAQKPQQFISSAKGAKIEVIQFHSEHRCTTCNNIEAYSKEALKSHPDVPFLLVNVDDSKNAKKAEQFEAAGTALFLYDPSTGKKKDLTDFAFMNAGNKDKFIDLLKKEIVKFKG